MTANRKLAAILAADVVGFSTMMQADEAGTLAVLKQRRKEILEPLVSKHRGRVVKMLGDGVLIEFGSAVAAVQCAVELQQAMAAANAANDPNGNNDKNVLLRIGVNLGDVLVEGSDLYGDGVNVAARLEALAEPGAICISAKVREEVQGKLDLSMEDRGEVVLKNMPRPVHVYRISSSADQVGNDARRTTGALPLPSKPSIAVLPFENLSGDPEQEYFADGIVEEIITALSRFRQLFVIARNSSFAYKGRTVDVKQVGRELGVRYVLESSLRRVSSRVRITGQLIDTTTGVHLWAERFDGQLEDIFDLQDQLTASVVGAIAPKLEQAEIEWSRRKPTGNLDAYDYYLRGLMAHHQWTRESSTQALSHFYRAIELDPNFAAAYGWAARCYSQRKVGGWVADPAQEIAECERLARLAAELGRDDAVALSTAGIALAYLVGDLEDGAAFTERALGLNPNLVWAWFFSRLVRLMLGEPEIAIERFARAMRLNPNDPQIYATQEGMAAAHFAAGRYGDALSWAKAAIREKPAFVAAISMVAASAALAGQLSEAQEAAARLRQLAPNLRVSDLKEPFSEMGADFALFAEGLRRAGLPE